MPKWRQKNYFYYYYYYYYCYYYYYHHEPYKGKGIRYKGEFIFRKEGKKK